VDKKIIAIICLAALVLILGGIIGYLLRPTDDGVSDAIEYLRWAGREDLELRNQLERAGQRISELEGNAEIRDRTIQKLEILAADRQAALERLTRGSEDDHATIGELRELTGEGRGIVEQLIKDAQGGTD
jgi:hypothetical protein